MTQLKKRKPITLCGQLYLYSIKIPLDKVNGIITLKVSGNNASHSYLALNKESHHYISFGPSEHLIAALHRPTYCSSWLQIWFTLCSNPLVKEGEWEMGSVYSHHLLMLWSICTGRNGQWVLASGFKGVFCFLWLKKERYHVKALQRGKVGRGCAKISYFSCLIYYVGAETSTNWPLSFFSNYRAPVLKLVLFCWREDLRLETVKFGKGN